MSVSQIHHIRLKHNFITIKPNQLENTLQVVTNSLMLFINHHVIQKNRYKYNFTRYIQKYYWYLSSVYKISLLSILFD
jgi:hypothetical protein